jgi:hypothetical protein
MLGRVFSTMLGRVFSTMAGGPACAWRGRTDIPPDQVSGRPSLVVEEYQKMPFVARRM